jgi:signal transduction histidine kinase
MAPTERPIIHALPSMVGADSRWTARGKVGDSNTAIREAKNLSKATYQPKVQLVEDNSVDAPVLSQMRLGRFDLTGKEVHTADEGRAGLNAECSEIVKVLCDGGVGVPPSQASPTPADVKAGQRIDQTSTDAYLKSPLIGLPESAEQLFQNKAIKRITKGRKLAEDQLAKKVDELARSNAELEQFAYVTSHDLQEPLRMVANYTQLLAERYTGKLDVQADKYIHYAVEGAARMQTLIQDLLAFSRAGGGAVNGIKSIESKSAVEQALKNLQIAIEESGAIVTCENLPVVMARPIQLQQVFQNLIANAIKFHSTATPQVQISAQKEGGEWVFSVTDNGIDIAPENAEVIFVIFQRLHSRTEYAGNGIGLAICKKIVEQQGGRIWLEPQAIPGFTTFKFTWPALDVDQSASKSELE